MLEKIKSTIKANPIKSIIAALIVLNFVFGKNKNDIDRENTKDPSRLVQDAANSLQKLHNSICNTPLREQIDRCVKKNEDRPDVIRWCRDILINAKREEGCL